MWPYCIYVIDNKGVCLDKFAGIAAFVAVVEEGTFAAAARAMGVSRAQVSKQVIQLEQSLGAQLLNRTTRSVATTATGRAFYDRARNVLNDLAEAEAAVQDDQADPQGEIKINAPMSFGVMHLAPAIADFMLRFPKIRIHLVLDDRFVDPVADGFDMTVRIGAASEHLSLIDHQIVEINRVICGAPELLKSYGVPKSFPRS